ncbi:hypothetical protein PT974_00945 [Cladobotryum mycophilum]|uniref:Uncharacterized protein n=1 Tax=Cladobotryum mycophilum TaxID=491253 RepID=A0ABR0T2B2_9HYPO
MCATQRVKGSDNPEFAYFDKIDDNQLLDSNMLLFDSLSNHHVHPVYHWPMMRTGIVVAECRVLIMHIRQFPDREKSFRVLSSGMVWLTRKGNIRSCTEYSGYRPNEGVILSRNFWANLCQRIQFHNLLSTRVTRQEAYGGRHRPLELEHGQLGHLEIWTEQLPLPCSAGN